MAARAHAALQGREQVTTEDLRLIAPLAFQHRRLGMDQSQDTGWTPEDEATLDRILNRGEATGRGEES